MAKVIVYSEEANVSLEAPICSFCMGGKYQAILGPGSLWQVRGPSRTKSP